VTFTITGNHATEIVFTIRTENVGHKFYMNNFFSPPYLFDNIHTHIIMCSGSQTEPKRRGEGDNTKGKHNVNMLANMHILKQKAISVILMKNSNARNAIL
jgi:hypothetical protein